MDYRTAYEELSKALWKFDKVHSEAYVQLMKDYKIIENGLDSNSPPISLISDRFKNSK